MLVAPASHSWALAVDSWEMDARVCLWERMSSTDGNPWVHTGSSRFASTAQCFSWLFLIRMFVTPFSWRRETWLLSSPVYFLICSALHVTCLLACQPALGLGHAGIATAGLLLGPGRGEGEKKAALQAHHPSSTRHARWKQLFLTSKINLPSFIPYQHASCSYSSYIFLIKMKKRL